MQGDVQGRCRVRQPADRDAIHTGTGDYPDVGERDPAGDLQDRCTVYGVRCTGAKSDRPTNVRDQPVIQEDCVRLRLQRGFKLVQIRHLDLNEFQRLHTFGSGDRPLYQLWSPTSIARGTRTSAPNGATSRPPLSCCTTVPPTAKGRGAMAGGPPPAGRR